MADIMSCPVACHRGGDGDVKALPVSRSLELSAGAQEEFSLCSHRGTDWVSVTLHLTAAVLTGTGNGSLSFMEERERQEEASSAIAKVLT
jgi:hypothetical protein